MQPVEVYFGFHEPWPSLWGFMGHCEAWFYTEDETWCFLDPARTGLHVRVLHRHDDVMDQLAARHELCATILRLPHVEPAFRLPSPLPATCASICGALVGIRAYTPRTLRRSLLRKGAVRLK